VTYLDDAVAPPAAAPWDVEDIASRALAILRLDDTDDDAPRVQTAAIEATELADQFLDYAETPWTSSSEIPAPVVGGAVNLTVELYRRKDAPFGVADAWSIDGALVHLSADVLKGVRGMLRPYRSRRGVA
jgi:hypothetical protein